MNGEMRKATFKLTGTNSLLMSNGRMAIPDDEHALEYARLNIKKPSVRSKAYKENPEILEEWYKKERRVQFFGLLYWDPSIGFYIPADNILYMIRESFFGYGTTSKGADRLQSVLRTDKEAYPFEYEGPDTPEARWEAGLYRVSTVPNRALHGAKVRVLQPFFHKGWSLTFTVMWDPDVETKDFLGKGKQVSIMAIHESLIWQGKTFGLGAYRKSGNYGNFVVEKLDT